MSDELKAWDVFGTVTVGISARVLARTKEEAVEEALDLPTHGLCHQCAEGGEEFETWFNPPNLEGDIEIYPVDVYLVDETETYDS